MVSRPEANQIEAPLKQEHAKRRRIIVEKKATQPSLVINDIFLEREYAEEIFEYIQQRQVSFALDCRKKPKQRVV